MQKSHQANTPKTLPKIALILRPHDLNETQDNKNK